MQIDLTTGLKFPRAQGSCVLILGTEKDLISFIGHPGESCQRSDGWNVGGMFAKIPD